MIETHDIPTPVAPGYMAFVGPNNSGKTAVVQLANFVKVRSKFNSNFDFLSLDIGHKTLGDSYAQFDSFCKDILGFEDVADLTDLHQRILAEDLNINSFIFTEQRQHDHGEDCIIAYLLPSFHTHTWVISRSGNVITTTNIALMSIIIGMVGICRVSSATQIGRAHV